MGGSGKQSLSRLAAYTAGCEVFEITLTRGYDDIAFRDDLKKLYGMLGSDDKKVWKNLSYVCDHSTAWMSVDIHCEVASLLSKSLP